MTRWLLAVVVSVGMVGWVSPARSQEEFQIAFVDAQEVLDRTESGKRAKGTMEEYRDSRQRIIDLEESEIKRLQDNLARQSDVLSKEALREKEESLKGKFMAYQNKVSELTRELETKKRDILKEFNNGLIEVVQRISEEKGYLMVFDRNAEGGVLLYAPDSLNITEDVIKAYDQSTP